MARIVKWEVRLEATDADGKTLTLPGLMTIAPDVDQADPDDFGLKLSEGKAILEQIQAQIATPEFDNVLTELGARHSFREAARIMNIFVPTSGEHSHTSNCSRPHCGRS